MDIPRKNQKRKRWLRRGLFTITAVILVGAATVGLSRLEPAVLLMRRLLLGIHVTDLFIFVAVPMGLIAVALLACWGPARRAARVNPMEVLRYE